MGQPPAEVGSRLRQTLHRDPGHSARSIVLIEQRLQAAHDRRMVGDERARTVQTLFLAAPQTEQNGALR